MSVLLKPTDYISIDKYYIYKYVKKVIFNKFDGLKQYSSLVSLFRILRASLSM